MGRVCRLQGLQGFVRHLVVVQKQPAAAVGQPVLLALGQPFFPVGRVLAFGPWAEYPAAFSLIPEPEAVSKGCVQAAGFRQLGNHIISVHFVLLSRPHRFSAGRYSGVGPCGGRLVGTQSRQV